MKLFPDVDTKKRFMKTGLPVILGIAWAPIIWMVVIAMFASPLFALSGSWLLTHGVILIIAFLVTFLFLRFFMRIGNKFYGEGH
ncbi:MAG: hypothetical protein FDX18_03710 [Chlorobium sp.]|nr:MAG: hypothetical protein FDX18_03710 [Chlorobium sp.]